MSMQRQHDRMLVQNAALKFFDHAISPGDIQDMLQIAPADVLAWAIEKTAAKDPAATVSQIRFAAIGMVLARRKAA